MTRFAIAAAWVGMCAAQAQQQAAHVQPQPADPGLARGVTALLAGRPAEAIGPLREAVKQNPNSLRAKDALAVAQAQLGQCPEALPALHKAPSHQIDANLKRAAGVAGVRCSMSMNDSAGAVAFLSALGREFPNDPDVLYLMVHAYSDLSIRASEDLARKAPGSFQAHQLNAEALEAQSRWDDAAKEYRQILAENPKLPGIHYRLGRILLSQPNGGPAEARKEFEAELAINPDHAGSEFVLAELSRQAEDLPEATKRFEHAAKLDVGFAEAHLGYGKCLLAENRPAEAIAPLQMAAKLQPWNPEPHYHLAIAYRRVGRKQDGDRESALLQTLTEKAQAASDARKQGAPAPQ